MIARRGAGARETFTVRKQSFGVGVERTFPVHSPKIERLEVVARGDVRRAKLYYLRGRVGKRARVAERRWGIEDDLVIAEDGAEAVDSEGVAQERGGVDRAAEERTRGEPSEADEAAEAEAAGGATPEASRSEESRAEATRGGRGRGPEDSEDQLIPKPTTGRGAFLELVVIVALAIGLAL